MKQKIILVMLILISTGLVAQNVNIPDANFKTYLVNNSLINTNNDGEIQISEAIAFTGGISCSNLNINDLKGIEAFTSIVELSCFSNQLSNLDLSANINLFGIECSGNMITTLDLPAASNTLEFLYCGANQISKLDVSTFTVLKELTCRYNQIDSLDLSASPVFISLICNDNQLNYLNIANGNNANSNFGYFETYNNPNLNCIKVDNSNYSTINWTSIDSNSTFYDAQIQCSVLSVENKNIEQIVSVYPNPTTTELSVTTNENVIINTITITDLFGRNIRKLLSKSKIDFSDLPNGIYFIQIEINNGNIVVHKIVKE